MEYLVGAVIGLLAGLGAGYTLNRLILGTAYRSRDGILKDAEREADTLRKSKELEIKEELLHRREELER